MPRLRHLEWFHDHVRIEQMLFDGAPRRADGAIQPDLGRPGHGLEFKAKDAERFRIMERHMTVGRRTRPDRGLALAGAAAAMLVRPRHVTLSRSPLIADDTRLASGVARSAAPLARRRVREARENWRG